MAFNRIYIKRRFLNSVFFSGIILANTFNAQNTFARTQEKMDISKSCFLKGSIMWLLQKMGQSFNR